MEAGKIIMGTTKLFRKAIGLTIGVSSCAAVAAFLKERFNDHRGMKQYHAAGAYERYWKRPLDAFLSSGALIVLSPVIAGTAILVRIRLGKPVLFTQERPGRDEKVFRLYKFRSMTDERDDTGQLLSDEQRLTPFGETLRKLSLDELPELFNILLGQMSLVGPRPLLVRYLPRYNLAQHRRHEVRPGLTGYAQVNGRNEVSWEERFQMDVYYVDHVSFWMDCKILLQTVVAVLRREGIHSETSATMEEFKGNSRENET